MASHWSMFLSSSNVLPSEAIVCFFVLDTSVKTSVLQLLIGKNYERESPSKADIVNMYNEDEVEPYYVNGPNSAQVNMTSAVSLLCRYCSSLSCDQYTTYAPEWYIDEQNNILGNKVRVVIRLPIVCPITEPIMVS
jgi:hypothetical protein